MKNIFPYSAAPALFVTGGVVGGIFVYLSPLSLVNTTADKIFSLGRTAMAATSMVPLGPLVRLGALVVLLMTILWYFLRGCCWVMGRALTSIREWGNKEGIKTNFPTRPSAKEEPASLRILKAIASQRALGIEDADRIRIQGLAAIPNKRSFDTTLSTEKKKGHLTFDSTTVRLTEAGWEEVEDAAMIPMTNVAMLNKLKSTIKVKKAREIFDVLADGHAYTRAELATKMGLENNNSFRTYVSALSKVVERKNEKIRLKEVSFPCGR